MNRTGEVVFHVLARRDARPSPLRRPAQPPRPHLRPKPGAALAAIVLKGLLVVSWLGLGWAGIRASTRRSWVVVAVPFVSFSIAWVVILIGNEAIGWTLRIGS